jgi:hypothetical protein
LGQKRDPCGPPGRCPEHKRDPVQLDAAAGITLLVQRLQRTYQLAPPGAGITLSSCICQPVSVCLTRPRTRHRGERARRRERLGNRCTTGCASNLPVASRGTFACPAASAIPLAQTSRHDPRSMPVLVRKVTFGSAGQCARIVAKAAAHPPGRAGAVSLMFWLHRAQVGGHGNQAVRAPSQETRAALTWIRLARKPRMDPLAATRSVSVDVRDDHRRARCATRGGREDAGIGGVATSAREGLRPRAVAAGAVAATAAP